MCQLALYPDPGDFRRRPKGRGPRILGMRSMVMLLENNPQEIFMTLPPYTPTVLALTNPELTTLVIRIDSSKPFEQEDLRVQVSFTGYEHSGTYLACVAFRIFDNPDDPLLGDAYLNPRQAIERKALENLTVQEQLPFIFLSEDLTTEVVKYLSWQERSRTDAQELLNVSAGVGLIEGSFDPEYQKIKERFQAAYSVKDLLSQS
jgi:hypothetical protein